MGVGDNVIIKLAAVLIRTQSCFESASYSCCIHNHGRCYHAIAELFVPNWINRTLVQVKRRSRV